MSRCRGCGNRVLWAVTHDNKRMPIDPLPTDGGNIHLTEGGDGRLIATVLGPLEVLDAPGRLHVSHFVTCPHADKFRGRPNAGGF